MKEPSRAVQLLRGRVICSTLIQLSLLVKRAQIVVHGDDVQEIQIRPQLYQVVNSRLGSATPHLLDQQVDVFICQLHARSDAISSTTSEYDFHPEGTSVDMQAITILFSVFMAPMLRFDAGAVCRQLICMAE